MKKSLIIEINVILILFIFIFSTVYAADAPDIQSDSASILVKLKLIQGYEDGSLRLQDRIKRSEFITLVVRMTGLDKSTGAVKLEVPFKDITPQHWAYSYIGMALKYGMVTGYPDGTIAPDNYVTYPEAAAVIIRVLGYESSLSGNWPENVINKSALLGMDKNLDISHAKQLTRGEMAVLIRNSMSVGLSQ